MVLVTTCRTSDNTEHFTNVTKLLSSMIYKMCHGESWRLLMIDGITGNSCSYPSQMSIFLSKRLDAGGSRYHGSLRKREMMKIRNHLWKKAKKTKDEHIWIEFRRVRNFVTSEMRRCKREYLEGVIHQAKKHPQKLWLEVNRLLGRHVRSHIQLLQTEDGEISDSQDIASPTAPKLWLVTHPLARHGKTVASPSNSPLSLWRKEQQQNSFPILT